MTQLASIVVALALVVPLVYLRLVGRPAIRRAYGRLVVRLAFAAAVVSAVVCLPLWVFMTPEKVLMVITGATTLCSFVLLLWGSALRWRLERFMRDVRAVKSGRFAPQQVERIVDFLVRGRPRAQELPSPYAINVLFAVDPLIAAGRLDEAQRLLGQLPFAWLTPAQHATYVNALVVTHYAQGDVQGAKKALEYRPADIEQQDQRGQLDLFEALFAGLAGDHERALALLERVENPVDPVLPHLVRAHALAARGAVEGARAALAMLQERDALAAAIEPEGPASKLAEALRGGKDAAYR